MQLSDVVRVLGFPRSRAFMHSSGTPITARSIWSCGCIVDSIEARSGDFNGALQWDPCIAHEDTSGTNLQL